jgi:hypothetical protein
MQNRSGQWLIPAVLALGAAGALWYYWARVSEPEPAPPPVAPAPAEESVEPIGPLHPIETDQAAGERPELVPLPPLDQADDYFRLGVVGIFGPGIEQPLANSGVIGKIVATVDNLPRSHIAEQVRPLGRLSEPFRVDGQDDSGEYWIDTGNYDRYDALVDMAMNADLDEAVELYRRFYPLFQTAYENLGYPDAYFNDRLVEVIDHLLATPEITDPVALVRPNVLYQYRDPNLEALSGGQKLLLRMGREHEMRIKRRLRELRERLTSL